MSLFLFLHHFGVDHIAGASGRRTFGTCGTSGTLGTSGTPGTRLLVQRLRRLVLRLGQLLHGAGHAGGGGAGQAGAGGETNAQPGSKEGEVIDAEVVDDK